MLAGVLLLMTSPSPLEDGAHRAPLELGEYIIRSGYGRAPALALSHWPMLGPTPPPHMGDLY
jgi:hypothetical protein